MPGLISSAAPGKKAAPKAPARRRPAPAVPLPSTQTPPSLALTTDPSTLLPTQPDSVVEQPAQGGTETTQVKPASTEAIREPEPEQSRRESIYITTPEPSSAPLIDSATASSVVEPIKAGVIDAQPVEKSSAAEQVDHERHPSEGPVRKEPVREESARAKSVRKESIGGTSVDEAALSASSLVNESPTELLVGAQYLPQHTSARTLELSHKSPTLYSQTSELLRAEEKQGADHREPRQESAARELLVIPAQQQQKQCIVGQQTAENRSAEYNVQDELLLEDTAPPEALRTSTRKPASRSAKRVRIDTLATETSERTKRVKRSSGRSNAKVQAIAQGEQFTSQNATEAPVDTDDAAETSQAQLVQKNKHRTRQLPNTKRKAQGRPKSAAKIVDSDDEGEAVQSLTASGELDDEELETMPARKRSRRKQKRAIPRKTETIAGEAEGEGEDNQPQSEDEQLELHEIDPSTLSMWDLSHDSRHGKTSEREREMAEINWRDVARQRHEAAELIAVGQSNKTVDGVIQSIEGPDEASTKPQTDARIEEQGVTEPRIGAGEEGEEDFDQTPSQDKHEGHHEPQCSNQEARGSTAGNGGNNNDEDPEENDVTLMLDAEGNIIVDENSRTVDRGAAVEAAMNSGKPIEDVNDLTVRMNRTTWMNNNRRDPLDRVPMWKWKSDPWPEEETDRFYEALRMFGTDFFIISKMFYPKTRRMIKAKFNREEKLDPQRINDALSGKSNKPMNLEHYSQQTGRDLSVYKQYEGYDHAQQIIQAAMREKENNMTTAIQQEAAAAEERAELEKLQKKEKKEKGRRGKGKKSKARNGGTMGGGPDEVAAE